MSAKKSKLLQINLLQEFVEENQSVSKFTESVTPVTD